MLSKSEGNPSTEQAIQQVLGKAVAFHKAMQNI